MKNWSVSPYINRFLGADTIVPGYTNPQNLNRYSYVTNNPLRYIDPTGHRACGDGEDVDCNGNLNNPTGNAGNCNGSACAGNAGGGTNNNENTASQSSGSAGCGQQGVYTSACPGWHEYTTTNVVCPAFLHCTREEMIYYLSLFAYPGQDPLDGPVIPGSTHSVNWPIPYIDISMGALGKIQVNVLDGGLTTVNQTLPSHILYDGKVERMISQLPSGAWIVTTHGTGNNVQRNVVLPLRGGLGTIRIRVNLASLNGWGGPALPGGVGIFNGLDAQMLNYITANH